MNPKDPRYAHLIGKHVAPSAARADSEAERLIPIIGDEHVDFEFGTGVLKVTPAHDKADFEIGQRHNLAGHRHHEARRHDERARRRDPRRASTASRRATSPSSISRELGVLVKEEPYQNNVGFSERADVPIEPRLSEQWFLKYPSVEQARAWWPTAR